MTEESGQNINTPNGVGAVSNPARRGIIRAFCPGGPLVLPKAENESESRYRKSVVANVALSVSLLSFFSSKFDWLKNIGEVMTSSGGNIIPKEFQATTVEKLKQLAQNTLFVDGIDNERFTLNRLTDTDSINVQAAINSFINNTALGLNGSVKMTPEEFYQYDPRIVEIGIAKHFLDIWGRHDQLTIGTFARNLSEGVDIQKGIEVIPRVGIDFLLSDYTYEEKPYGVETELTFSSDSLIAFLEENREDAKIINMSLQLGKGKLLIETKVPGDREGELKEAERVGIRVIEPLSPLLGEEQLEQNLMEYIKLATAFPDKLFVMAAGNQNSDISQIRQKLEERGEWPENILMTGFVVKNSFDEGYDSYGGGADVYVDGLFSSSEATAFVSALATLVNNGYPNLSPKEIKAQIYKMTQPAKYTRIPPVIGLQHHIDSGVLYSNQGMNEYVVYESRIINPKLINAELLH